MTRGSSKVVGHAIASSLINTDVTTDATLEEEVDVGLARVGTRAQVDESVVRRGRGREYRTRVGIPVFNAFPSTLNQLDTTSTLLPLVH